MAKRIEDFGMDRKMLKRMTWKSTFADYLSKLVGYPIAKEHIYSDQNACDFSVIPNCSLLPNYPLLLVDCTGLLMAIIPYKDYMQLENGEVYPLPYIAGVHWNYGKYSGEEDVRTGIFWKPLEAREGISDTERISEYLNMIGKLRVHPEDFRQGLFAAVKRRVRMELDLEVGDFMSYNGENVLLIADPSKRDTVTCILPAILLNDILYHPGEREWEVLANSFIFELGVNHNRRRYVIPDNYIGNRVEFCHKVWRSFGLTSRWYASNPVNTQAEKASQHQKLPKSDKDRFKIFGIVRKLLKRKKKA